MLKRAALKIFKDNAKKFYSTGIDIFRNNGDKFLFKSCGKKTQSNKCLSKNVKIVENSDLVYKISRRNRRYFF